MLWLLLFSLSIGPLRTISVLCEDRLPVGERSLPDLDCAQLLDAALQTNRHVGVRDTEGLPLPARGAAGREAVRWGRGDGGGAGSLLHQRHLLAACLEQLLVHKLVVLRNRDVTGWWDKLFTWQALNLAGDLLRAPVCAVLTLVMFGEEI